MAKVSFSEIKKRCIEGRFYSYEGLNDKVYAPVSVFLVWVFVRAGWSGNAVSILSGVIAMVGGMLMASNDPVLVIAGSFGYIIFFLLDYVDGGVARIRGKSGIGGQYVDWSMHVVSALGIGSGMLAGAVLAAGFWVVPFGVLTIVAMALALDRYALGWFAICMYYQQQRVKGVAVPINVQAVPYTPSFFYRWCRNITTVLFHESYAIYLFPTFAIAQYFFPVPGFDFRVLLMIAGGLLYFPVVIYDLWRLAAQGKIDKAFNELFYGETIPNLPNDHFFGE